jgi:hypothetical protein
MATAVRGDGSAPTGRSCDPDVHGGDGATLPGKRALTLFGLAAAPPVLPHGFHRRTRRVLRQAHQGILGQIFFFARLIRCNHGDFNVLLDVRTLTSKSDMFLTLGV